MKRKKLRYTEEDREYFYRSSSDSAKGGTHETLWKRTMDPPAGIIHRTHVNGSLPMYCFVGIGFVLGGTFGMGTIICAFLVGPVAEKCMPVSSRFVNWCLIKGSSGKENHE